MEEIVMSTYLILFLLCNEIYKVPMVELLTLAYL